MKKTIFALILLTLSSVAAAQDVKSPPADMKAEPAASPSPAPDPDAPGLQQSEKCSNKGQGKPCYEFPDRSKRFKRYLNNAFGPTAYVGPAIGATFQTISENPPEWEKNAKGFARRFASNVAKNVIEESVVYAGSELLKQDPKYYKCECKNIGKRVVHALKSGFTARNKRGRTVFAPQKVAAPFVSNVTATTVWYPERYSAQDGLRRGGYGLLFSAGFNLLREFVF